MNVKNADIRTLETFYEKEGSQLILLYGCKDCRKEQVIRSFAADKNCFYYRCRQAAAADQCRMMGEEIARQFEVQFQENACRKRAAKNL